MNSFHEEARGSSACEWLDDVAVYLTGALDEQRSRELEAHLESGCDACHREMELDAATLAQLDRLQAEDDLRHDPTLAPSAELRERLVRAVEAHSPRKPARVNRTWQNWTDDGAPQAGLGEVLGPGLTTVLSSPVGWESVGVKGVSVRKLSVDAQRRNVTMLVRMEPGSSYPSHRHAGREECFVLSGSLEVAGRTLNAGDYQVADQDSVHGVQSTREGCLLLIVSSQDDELV